MLRAVGRRLSFLLPLTPGTVRAQESGGSRTADAVKGAVEKVAVDASPPGWLESSVPDGLRRSSFLLENWQWLGLLALAIVGIILDRVLVTILQTVLTRIYRRFLPRGDTKLVRSAVRPLGILAMAIVWYSGLGWLGLTGGIRDVLSVAVAFLAAGAGVWAAYKLVDIVAEYLGEKASHTETRYDDLLVPLIRKSLKVFIVAFGLVFIADNLDVDITSLLAGLGLGGLAFALAAQDMVKNLFGSLTVLLDRPFQVGDWVKIGDLEGTVEEVGFRSSRIRTFYNSMITMPNANLISTAVDNLGARSYRRWKATLSLTYDTPPEKLDAFCEGVRELVRQHPHTRKDYFHVYANHFGAASLDVLLYVFFVTADWGKELQARHRLFLDILRLASEVGVEFAFPTQTLHVFRPGEEPTHDDAPRAGEEVQAGKAAAERVLAFVSEAEGRASTATDPKSGGDAG